MQRGQHSPRGDVPSGKQPGWAQEMLEEHSVRQDPMKTSKGPDSPSPGWRGEGKRWQG